MWVEVNKNVTVNLSNVDRVRLVNSEVDPSNCWYEFWGLGNGDDPATSKIFESENKAKSWFDDEIRPKMGAMNALIGGQLLEPILSETTISPIVVCGECASAETVNQIGKGPCLTCKNENSVCWGALVAPEWFCPLGVQR